MGMLVGIFAEGPAKAGDSFGAPGQGRSVAISVVTIAALFALWFGVTGAGMIDPLFLPSPGAILDRFVEVLLEGFGGALLWEHTWESLKRVFGAFFLAVITAIPVGILMGVNRVVRGIFDPPIEFYRPIPPLAYLPLMVIWFGIGETTKIIVIYLAVFAPMALNARAGVRSVSIEQIHAAYSMGATRLQVIWHVILKAAMPEILTGMRIGIGFGWTTLVAAELVAAQAGLGAMIQQASDFLVTDVTILGIVVIGAVAYLFDLLMRWTEKVVVPWKGKV
jgi:taurine transport system permease protein